MSFFLTTFTREAAHESLKWTSCHIRGDQKLKTSTSLSIMDIYGRILINQYISEGQNTINLSSLPSVWEYFDLCVLDDPKITDLT
ncbi:MAG: hypothetical protein IPJ13_13175 [Saprospiraceae bacterium]|nr:hypothetical protein [Saprospiraceae bacterium]